MTPLTHPNSSHLSPQPARRAAFAAGVLGLGLLAAFIGIAMTDSARAVTGLPTLLNLPPWVFWMVWMVIYPAMGVALWHVWSVRQHSGGQTALFVFALAFASNLIFMPLNALLPGLWTAFLLDLVGLVGALVLAWAFRRVAPVSLPWLLPLLIWLPITTLNKLPGIMALLG